MCVCVCNRTKIKGSPSQAKINELRTTLINDSKQGAAHPPSSTSLCPVVHQVAPFDLRAESRALPQSAQALLKETALPSL